MTAQAAVAESGAHARDDPRLVSWMERHWERATPVSVALLPLSWLYGAAVWLRRMFYRYGLLRSVRVAAPVIVVGNLTLGGTGKTPLVIWLVSLLRSRGYKPGIVTRGYKGGYRASAVLAAPSSRPQEIGDEAVLLARRSGCPVMVARERALAAGQLVRQCGCDVIISDDGLQHYALPRDIEIAVIDGSRRFGNGYCLPAGPLREPLGRLRQVHVRVTHGEPRSGEIGMKLKAMYFRRVGARDISRPVQAFAGQRAHAVAGIGYPSRFFSQLRGLGIDIDEHAFADHYDFAPRDVQFADALPIIMTEKDAVKCERFADQRHWYLEVEAEPDPALAAKILGRLHDAGLRTED